MPYLHPRFRIWLDVAGVLVSAAELAAAELKRSTRHRSARPGFARKPGVETPMWNALERELRAELQMHGAKVRLARYLGIPKQRITDYLRGSRRLPDAELALRMLHWMAERRAGRDPSL